MPQEVIAVSQTYDLVLWAIPQVGKFPREHKFAVGERIVSHLYDLLEILIAASYTTDKADLLAQASGKVNILRHLMRLAKDLKLLSLSRYEFASKNLVEIGKQVGGWKKASSAGTRSAAGHRVQS